MSDPSPSAILTRALAAHQQGDLVTADRLYREILEADPADADALHWLGVLAMQIGAPEIAVNLIGDSLKVRPGDALATANFGNAYRAQGAWVEAEAAFAQALTLQPGFVDVWIRYADMAREQNNHAAARPRLEQALVLDSNNVNALFVLGEVCRELNDHGAARVHWLRCAELDPDDRTGVRLALAALGALPTPDRPDPAWIATLFDSYASGFDRHLIETLGYVGPELVAAAASRWAGDRIGTLAVADVGCGTGLAGISLKPISASLVGVDLSAAMIELARERGLYDRLAVEDLIVWLSTEREMQFDLIVAADVFNYFGDLAPPLRGVWRCLKPGGRLIATLEELEGPGDDGYRLAPALRYLHAPAYLETVAAANGLHLVASHPVTLRRQAGEPVRSLLIEMDRL